MHALLIFVLMFTVFQETYARDQVPATGTLKLNGFVNQAQGYEYLLKNKICTLEVEKQNSQEVIVRIQIAERPVVRLIMRSDSLWVGEFFLGYDYAYMTPERRISGAYSYQVRSLIKWNSNKVLYSEQLLTKSQEFFDKSPYYFLECQLQ